MGGPGLTLLAPRARVAGLTRTQAADRITTPVAYTAAAGVAAVGSPVAAVAGCNTTQVSPHRPGRTHDQPVTSSPPHPGPGPRAHTPLCQLRPVHPGAQLQRPVTGWQCPSLAQEHLIWQPGPNQPAGHAAGRGSVSGGWGRPGSGLRSGGHGTHRPGSGCPCSRGGTGRLRSRARRRHRAHTRGRSPGSPAPSGLRDNLPPPPQPVSLPGGLAGPGEHGTDPVSQPSGGTN